ncbi:protein-export chaperone SecB [Oleispirillum naphthae]|uniref:protein-export chaperone SecB n=1 Tax=Oleispirillum naphthae TaxID=2838853 RepID=UPI0030826691
MTEGQDAAGAENQTPAPPLTINGQFIKDFSFEAPHVPEIFADMASGDGPSIGISVDVKATQLHAEMYEVDLILNVEAKTEEKPAFLVEILYCGIVTLNVPEEHLKPMLFIEVPRHLFPFARAVVAGITRDAGFPPLMIAPIDFVEIYQQRMAEAEAKA